MPHSARGLMLLLLGLLLAAAQLAGHHLALRHGIAVETAAGTGLDDGALAEDVADIRHIGGMAMGFLVVCVSVALTCAGAILPRLRGPIRTATVVASGLVWASYPVVAFVTLTLYGALMVGDGGNTGLHHEYARRLPLMLLLVAGAAVLQATGLIIQSRTRPTTARGTRRSPGS